MSSRIQVILSDEDIEALDGISKRLSLNRSQTIRKLIKSPSINIPVYISNKDMIGLVNELDMNIKALIVDETLDGDSAIKLVDIIKHIKDELKSSFDNM